MKRRINFKNFRLIPKQIIRKESLHKAGFHKLRFAILFFLPILLSFAQACGKESTSTPVLPAQLGIDSLVATKRNLVVWEETRIIAYAHGENILYHWTAKH
jgi:hypothetical protein